MSSLAALERSLHAWMMETLGVEEGEEEREKVTMLEFFSPHLSKTLLSLIRKVNPAAEVSIHEDDSSESSRRENIVTFLDQVRSLGFDAELLFEVDDMFHLDSPTARASVLHSLEAIFRYFSDRGWAPEFTSIEDSPVEAMDSLREVVKRGSEIVSDQPDRFSATTLEKAFVESPESFSGFQLKSPYGIHEFEFESVEVIREKGAGGLDRPFWSYIFRCKTSNPMFQSSDFQFKRRYKDFIWMRDILTSSFPSTVIPPIPPKSATSSLAKFVGVNDDEVVSYRRRALLKFLCRVSSIPCVVNSWMFRQALEEDHDKITLYRLGKLSFQADERSAPASDSATVVGIRLRELNATLGRAIRGTRGGNMQDWVDSTSTYLGYLEGCLRSLRDRCNTQVLRRRELATSIRGFGSVLERLGETEISFNESALGESLIKLGSLVPPLEESLIRQTEIENDDIMETIQYYEGMVEAVREPLSLLNGLRQNFVSLENDLESLLLKRENTANRGKDVTQLDVEIDSLLSRKNESKDVLDLFEKEIRGELERFQAMKQFDFRCLMGSFVSVELEYAKSIKLFWNEMTPAIEKLRHCVE